MKSAALCVLLLALVGVASATVYFKETFGDDWDSRWKVSDWKKGELGQWKHTAGEWYGDKEADKGLQTSQDARFYAISSHFPKFSNAGKELVIQFAVRFPQRIDCGGGYIKVFPSTTAAKEFGGDAQYNIMFGPDVCGTSTKKVHVIFNFGGKNLLVKKEIRAETDTLTHVYTLVVRPDDTYEVLVDGEKRESGSLSADWDFLLPKTIKDPAAKKPSDWVDNAKMDDPTDVKPENYDDIPKEIPDPDAEKPSDWDEESDGKWEAPTIPNPEYKGQWKPRQIDNPAYKGPWKHPEIDNPDYVDHKDLYKYDDFGGVGIDVWQVKSGTIFDNIIIADSLDEVKAFGESTFPKSSRDAEKAMFEEADKKKKEEEEAERKRIEDERKKQDEVEKKSDDDDDDDDEEDDDEKNKNKEEL
jgi:calreticulin